MSGDVDLEALVAALRADPRRLDELRRLLAVPDEPELRSALAQLTEAQTRTEQRLEQLVSRVDALAEQVSTLAEQVSTLAEQMSTLAGHVNWLRGDALERRYREKGNAYLSGVARRLRVLSSEELDDVLDPAIEAGTLTDEEAHRVRLLDAVYRGVRQGERCFVAVEVSVGVGLDDVRRVSERAELLARTGTPTLAAVAGEWVNPEAADAARATGVWQITNGRASAPAA